MKRRDFIIGATCGVGAAWIGSRYMPRAMSAIPDLPRKFNAADTVVLGNTGIPPVVLPWEPARSAADTTLTRLRWA